MTLAKYGVPLCLLLAATPGWAQEASPLRLPLWCRPRVAMPGNPPPTCATPATPVTPTTPADPNVPVPPPTPSPDPSGQGSAFSQAPEGGTQPAASYSPNMYGDLFGGPLQRLLILRSPIVVAATPGTPATPAVNKILGGTFLSPNASNPANPAAFLTQNVSQPTVINPLIFMLSSKSATLPGVTNVTFTPPLTHMSTGPVVVPVNGLQPGNTVALQEQPQVRAGVLQSASSQFGAGGTLTLLNSTGILTNSPAPPGQATWNITTTYDYFVPANPGTTGTPAQLIQRPSLFLTIPTPSGGGFVGLTKIAEDNSPIPHDRFILGYDYYDRVPLTAQNANVHRFSLGFEKTFLDGRASLELRVPFASTVGNNLLADGISSDGHAEFGDANITMKALLYRSPVLNVAAGLGIALPTADEVNVSLSDGTPLLRINNDAVLLTPYICYVVTPNDRLFFQNWYEFVFAANGNTVLANPNFTGLSQVGRLSDQSLLEIDAQLGYWVYRSQDSSAWLRGLAPFVELHYNTTMGKSDTLQAGAFVLGDPNNHLDELNLTAGFSAQIGSNFNLSAGAVLPLKGGQDRSFDWQVGIRGNWVFGRSARDRDRTSQATTY